MQLSSAALRVLSTADDKAVENEPTATGNRYRYYSIGRRRGAASSICKERLAPFAYDRRRCRSVSTAVGAASADCKDLLKNIRTILHVMGALTLLE